MNNSFMIKAPSGGEVLIDVSEIKLIKIKETRLTIEIFDNKELFMEGNSDELSKIADKIVEEKNKYRTYLDNRELEESVLKEASEKALEYTKEVIKETIINEFKETLTEVQSMLASSQNMNKEMKIVETSFTSMKEKINDLEAEIKRLKNTLFEKDE